MNVNVNFMHHRVKVAVQQSTTLLEVKNYVCTKLELNSGIYTLCRQKKPLDLSVQFRFANLVNNAQLDLEKVKLENKNLRVKIKLPNGDFVGSFVDSTTVGELKIGVNIQGTLTLSGVEVSDTQVLGGIGGSPIFAVANVQAPNAPAQAPNAPAPNAPQAQAPQAQAPQAPAPMPAPQAPAPDAPEMTQSQFMVYLNHLKKQAEPPLISKSTREKLKPVIEHCTVKIKFPNNAILEHKFTQHETGANVIDFVKTKLLNSQTQFTLESKTPKFTLNENTNIVSALGSRCLLYFNPIGPKQEVYIKNERLQTNMEAKVEAHSEAPVEAKVEAPVSPKKKKFSKPKWLKLHK